MPVTVTATVGPSGVPGLIPANACSIQPVVTVSSRSSSPGPHTQIPGETRAQRHLVGATGARRATVGDDRGVDGRGAVVDPGGESLQVEDRHEVGPCRAHGELDDPSRRRSRPACPVAAATVSWGFPLLMITTTSDAWVASRKRSNAVRDRSAAHRVASTTATVDRGQQGDHDVRLASRPPLRAGERDDAACPTCCPQPPLHSTPDRPQRQGWWPQVQRGGSTPARS